MSKGVAALDWTKDPEVVAYLRRKGAKKVAELKGEVTQTATPTNVLEEVIRYFRENFGDVDERAIIEIVPTGFPVTVHAIPPTKNRNHLTLFTTGLSSKRMNVHRN